MRGTVQQPDNRQTRELMESVGAQGTANSEDPAAIFTAHSACHIDNSNAAFGKVARDSETLRFLASEDSFHL